jgi:hypothetical protein
MADCFGVTEQLERNQSRYEERTPTFQHSLSFASNLKDRTGGYQFSLIAENDLTDCFDWQHAVHNNFIIY